MKDDFGEEVYALKDMSPTKTAAVIPLTFGRARIVIGPKGEPFYDNGW